ncbi:hypothetical protein [Acetobacter sp.]|uniref:hypothetical protein n=1 Tax=Acetobacter sp. TaxID=440 RepID=UPI0039EB4446
MPLAIPDWLPLWAQFLLLGLGIVVLVAFLLMPFAVFGVKGRLREIELQLEDVRADLRVITMRLGSVTPEPKEAAPRVARAAPSTEEWTPPPPRPEPEFRPHSPRPVGLAPSPLLPPEMQNGSAEPMTPKAGVQPKEVDSQPPRIFPERQAPATNLGSAQPTPRVSDAYEPSPARPPELRASRFAQEEQRPETVRPVRMPWHEPTHSQTQKEPNWDQKISKDGQTPHSDGRNEPVLRWPSRPTE